MWVDEPVESSASTTISGSLIWSETEGEQFGYIDQYNGWGNQELKQGRSLAIATRPRMVIRALVTSMRYTRLTDAAPRTRQRQTHSLMISVLCVP